VVSLQLAYFLSAEFKDCLKMALMSPNVDLQLLPAVVATKATGLAKSRLLQALLKLVAEV
jgi:Mg-chelatase subunit ChlI